MGWIMVANSNNKLYDRLRWFGSKFDPNRPLNTPTYYHLSSCSIFRNRLAFWKMGLENLGPWSGHLITQDGVSSASELMISIE